jgi:type IV pilus assembly protein PilA
MDRHSGVRATLSENTDRKQSAMSIGTDRGKLEPEGGFTIVELFIVVAVLGVLLAIGIPTLLGSKTKVSDTAAKAIATDAVKSQKALYSDHQQAYGDADQLKAVEPSLKAQNYSNPATTVPQVLGTVFVRNDAGQVATMVARSSSGTCFWTREANGITTYAKNDCSSEPTSFTSSW